MRYLKGNFEPVEQFGHFLYSIWRRSKNISYQSAYQRPAHLIREASACARIYIRVSDVLEAAWNLDSSQIQIRGLTAENNNLNAI